MFFTQEDYRKIEKWLLANSVKDTEFAGASLPLKGNETVAFVQNGKNVNVLLKDLIEQIFLLGVSDFLNVTDKYGESRISLTQAIQLIPYKSRKIGQVITFLDEDGEWKLFQFQGERVNQWNNATLWVDLIERIQGISIIDSEDITATVDNLNQTSLTFADKNYNTTDYSGLGRVYLRKNIQTVVNPNTGITYSTNFLTQAMLSKENTIYIIQYDYNLNGQTITIPSGCVLLFEGGSISNGTINFTNTIFKGDIIYNNIVPTGTIDMDSIDVSWFGAKENIIDNSTIFNNVASILYNTDKEFFVPSGTYNIKNTVDLYTIRRVTVVGKIVNDDNAPVIIGNTSNLTYECNYNIADIDYIQVHGGKNIHAEILRSLELSLIADSSIASKNAIAYCTFNLGLIESLNLIGKGTGWINENSFYNNRTRTLLITGEQYAHNNNIFFSPRLENCTIRIEKGHNNTFYNCRFEGNYANNTIYFGEGTYSNIFYKTWVGHVSYPMNGIFNKALYPNITNDGYDTNRIFIDTNGLHIEKVLGISKGYKNLDVSISYPTSTGYFLAGSATLALSSPVSLSRDFGLYLKGDREYFRISLTFYNSSGVMVPLTEIPSWIYSFNHLRLNNGILAGASNSSTINISVLASQNTNVDWNYCIIRVYTGASYTGDRNVREVEVYTIQPYKDEIAINFPLNQYYTAGLTPSSDGIYEAGDECLITSCGQMIIFDGTSWVNEDGTLVSKVVIV